MSETFVRYVAGLSVDSEKKPIYSVFAMIEDENKNRLGHQSMISDMTKEQAEHLHFQLGNVLGLGGGR